MFLRGKHFDLGLSRPKPPSESSLLSAEIGRDFDIHTQEMMDWIGKKQVVFFLSNMAICFDPPIVTLKKNF